MPVYRDNETVECWKGPESQPKPDTANESVLRHRCLSYHESRFAYLTRDEPAGLIELAAYLADHEDQHIPPES
jgi:hypothetical protein